jgi:polyribonucleotide nucleotidyltransferase
MMGPKRREIGHGRLAKRGVLAVMPTMEEFPYTIRVVSEITESNGSSLDGLGLRQLAGADGRRRADQGAGRRHRDGPGQGRRPTSSCCPTSSATKITSATWTSRWPVPANGISALQMDIKIDGITEEIMKVALAQAKQGRLHILGEMAKALTAPRAELSSTRRA